MRRWIISKVDRLFVVAAPVREAVVDLPPRDLALNAVSGCLWACNYHVLRRYGVIRIAIGSTEYRLGRAPARLTELVGRSYICLRCKSAEIMLVLGLADLGN